MEKTLEEMNIDKLKEKRISIIFSALPADVAKTFEAEAAQAGFGIFSNAGAYRMNASVPILIPEINYEHIGLIKKQTWKSSSGGFIVTNANCTTTGLCLSLAPIADLGIEELVVSSYQALSGAGYPGHTALEMSANCIPHIPGEEHKVKIETRKIFGKFDRTEVKPADWAVYPHCIRVSNIVGHLISVHVKLSQSVDYDTITSRIREFKAKAPVSELPTAPEKPILLFDEPNRPQPRLDVNAGEPVRAKGMAVSIGKLCVTQNIIRFVTLSHNLIRGAAGGSILNAEILYKEGLL